MTRASVPNVVSGLQPRPPSSSPDLKGVLISEQQIQARIQSLGQELNETIGTTPTIVIGVLNGTILFMADLLRELSMPVRIDIIGASSYGDGATSGPLTITRPFKVELQDQHILLLDDILDTGKTLSKIIQLIRDQQPKSLRTCVLLDKPDGRVIELEADHVGFTIPNEFVVGYGLDYAEHFRNLPYIGVLDPSRLPG